MSSSLVRFLTHLATDAELMGKYLDEPEATMRQFELSESDIELLLCHDILGLERRLRGSEGQNGSSSYPAAVYPPVYPGWCPQPPTVTVTVSFGPSGVGYNSPGAVVPVTTYQQGGPPVPGPLTHFVPGPLTHFAPMPQVAPGLTGYGDVSTPGPIVVAPLTHKTGSDPRPAKGAGPAY